MFRLCVKISFVQSLSDITLPDGKDISEMFLRNAREDEYEKIKDVYMYSFPPEERMPWQMLEEKCRSGALELLTIADDSDIFAGFFLIMKHRDLILPAFFAIDNARRGEGIGSEALHLLCLKYSASRIFLEIELPDPEAKNNEQRLRRKNFYLRNGFSESGILLSFFGVPMEILTYRCTLTPEEYSAVYLCNSDDPKVLSRIYVTEAPGYTSEKGKAVLNEEEIRRYVNEK